MGIGMPSNQSKMYPVAPASLILSPKFIFSLLVLENVREGKGARNFLAKFLVRHSFASPSAIY
jgi:hypothetical protein